MSDAQFTKDTTTITQDMLKCLNSWEEKPAIVTLDDLDSDVESMMLQPLAGTQKLKTYVNGSYYGQWSFAVYYRVKNADTKDRINARKVLEKLDEWFRKKDSSGKYINLPTLDGRNTAIDVVMSSTPSLAAMYDNGIEDYQVIFNLSYYHKEV